MKLREVLEILSHHDVELDIKVCYSNEFGEECTWCRTFVQRNKYKEGKKYWASDWKVIQYDYCFPADLKRYEDFDVSMLTAEGKGHFFVFASNFK